MNKTQIKRLKEIVGYNPELPEHKRLLRRLKKEYQRMPRDKKVNLLEDLKQAFNTENE